MDAQSQIDPAAGLLLKLRDFAKDLNDQERSLFAVLVGPGVQQLTGDLDEVSGFQAEPKRWEPGSLRDQLSDAVTSSEWQMVEPRD